MMSGQGGKRPWRAPLRQASSQGAGIARQGYLQVQLCPIWPPSRGCPSPPPRRSGDTVCFGTFNRFYIYSFNSTRHTWEEVRGRKARASGGRPEAWLVAGKQARGCPTIGGKPEQASLCVCLHRPRHEADRLLVHCVRAPHHVCHHVTGPPSMLPVAHPPRVGRHEAD